MEKEREDDLQNLWVLIQGSRDQAQHSPTGHVGCGPCRQMLYVLRPSSLHSNDILMRTTATLWPPKGRLGSPLSTKWQNAEWQRQMLAAPWHPSSTPWSLHSERWGTFRN